MIAKFTKVAAAALLLGSLTAIASGLPAKGRTIQGTASTYDPDRHCAPRRVANRPAQVVA